MTGATREIRLLATGFGKADSIVTDQLQRNMRDYWSHLAGLCQVVCALNTVKLSFSC